MFKFEDLKCIHIEITSRCQASCPMCNRNLYGGLKNPRLILSDWSLEDFQNIINEEVLKNLYQIMFCGHFGDPLINPHFADMIKYIKNVNPEVMVNLHTNGSFFKEDWWSELANILPKNHSVHISLDGLEDTHHLYRIGTDWNKILNNARAFINAGGIATWEFIRFKHNEHQVDEARRLSEEYGFKFFSVKDTSRYIDGEPYKVLDKDGNLLYYLEPPTNNSISYVGKDMVNNYKKFMNESIIECKALHLRQIYIDSLKRLFPCGFLGQSDMTMTNYGDIVDPLRKESLDENLKVFSRFPTLDLTKTSIKEIINSNEWQTIWNEYIHEDKRLLTCVRNCGKFSKPLTTFEHEIIEKKLIN